MIIEEYLGAADGAARSPPLSGRRSEVEQGTTFCTSLSFGMEMKTDLKMLNASADDDGATMIIEVSLRSPDESNLYPSYPGRWRRVPI